MVFVVLVPCLETVVEIVVASALSWPSAVRNIDLPVSRSYTHAFIGELWRDGARVVRAPYLESSENLELSAMVFSMQATRDTIFSL